MMILADNSWTEVIILWSVIGLLVVTGLATVWIRDRLNPTILSRLRRFFRGSLADVEVHEKSFPGYDLATVNLALKSFFDDCCARTTQVGGCSFVRNLRDLLDKIATPYQRNLKPTAPPYERLPIDVDAEESFMSNCLWLCELKPGVVGGAAGDGRAATSMAVLLASSSSGGMDFEEDMDVPMAPSSLVNVSVACRSRAVADRFFAELESRRKRLSIYRGKVIDPSVSHGGIRSIGFKRIHAVRDADLVLTDGVKRVIDNSIVGFYRHQETLRKVGVEMKRGILFHSPPGTGKTSISLYLAGLLPNFTVCFVSGRRLLHPRELCSMARYLQPSMLVFEDIDLIANERDTNGLATVLGELMNQIDGCEPNDQVLFIMNTNSMDRIEQAVRNRPGRVDQIIHLALPDEAARRQLLAHFARHVSVEAGDLDRAAAATEGATPATLKEVVKRATVHALEAGVLPAGGWSTGGGGANVGETIRVTAHDLLFAYEQVQFMRPQSAPGRDIL